MAPRIIQIGVRVSKSGIPIISQVLPCSKEFLFSSEWINGSDLSNKKRQRKGTRKPWAYCSLVLHVVESCIAVVVADVGLIDVVDNTAAAVDYIAAGSFAAAY